MSGALIWGLGMLTLVAPVVAVPAVIAEEAYLRFLAEGGMLRIESVGPAIGAGALGVLGLLVGGGMRFLVALMSGKKVVSEETMQAVLMNEGLRYLFFGVGWSAVLGSLTVPSIWSFAPPPLLGPMFFLFLYLGGGSGLLYAAFRVGDQSRRLMIGPRFVRTVHGLNIRDSGEPDTVKLPPLEY